MDISNTSPTIKTVLSDRTYEFLRHFPNTLFTYIADNKNIHVEPYSSPVLDLEKQKDGYGVYLSVNGFEGRRTAEHLTNVNGFFCDIDYPNKGETDKGKIAAYKNEIVMELTNPADDTGNGGLIPTFIVGTKNGLHVYWMLTEPLYTASFPEDQVERLKDQYRQIEEAILKRFDGDPGAKDIARVLRVPETLHQKDPSDPFEIKLLWSEPEITYTYSEIRDEFTKIQKAFDDRWMVAGESHDLIDDDVKKKIEETYPRLDRPSFKALLDRTAPVPEGLRNKSLLIIAYACKESGWPISRTYGHFTDFYKLGLREIRRTIASAYEHSYDFGYKNEVMATIADTAEKTKLSEVTTSILSKTKKQQIEITKAEQKAKYAGYESIIAERYPHLKYKQRGDFYDYSEGIYRPIQLNEVQSIFLREMLSDGLLDYRRVALVNDKIACFKSLPNKVFSHEDENKDRDILNLKNGLLNIRTKELLPHTPNYISTVQIPIVYQEKAASPTWERFVSEIMDNDGDQVALLRQITGYILTADTRFAKAFIFYGYGANGKSLFTRIISRLVGKENVSNINLTALNKQFGLTGLIGKRLNLIDEISGNYFESNIIKTIISGERVSADIKYRPEPLEFEPTVKLVFSVNELPKINDTTPGLYRRFMIIPFLRTFLKNPDLNLEAKLANELPGILNWAIEGLEDLSKKGAFSETQKNFDAMKAFKTENSPLIEYIQEAYEPVPEGEKDQYPVRASDLYSGYRNYCYVNGYKAKAMVNFARELQHASLSEYVIERRLMRGATVYYGIRSRLTAAGEDITYPSVNINMATIIGKFEDFSSATLILAIQRGTIAYLRSCKEKKKTQKIYKEVKRDVTEMKMILQKRIADKKLNMNIPSSFPVGALVDYRENTEGLFNREGAYVMEQEIDSVVIKSTNSVLLIHAFPENLSIKYLNHHL